jgi:hypothetical protein
MGTEKNKIIKIGIQILTVRDLISIYQGNVYEAVPAQYAACRKNYEWAVLVHKGYW